MKDRISLYPGRVKLNPVAGEANTYDMVRADQPTQEGTALNKELFDKVIAAYGTTTGTGTAYALAGDGGFTLTDGATVRFKIHVDSGATPTLNVNGTGAVPIMETKSKAMKAGVAAGTWLTAVYCEDFGFFVLQGSSSNKTNKGFGNDYGQISLEYAKIIPLGLGRIF